MIARVVIDSPLPHLDKPFDYAIGEALDGIVEVGSRVRVPFAGRLSSAVVVEMTQDESPHQVKAIKSASGVPSFTQEALDLAASIAQRYGGSLWDVLRLMAPARVAGVEKLDWAHMTATPLEEQGDAARFDPAGELGLPLAAGARCAWVAPPMDGASMPAAAIASWALFAAGGQGTAIIVVPDARAVHALIAHLTHLGLRRWTARTGGHFAVLDADEGPSVRFGSYLAAMRGLVKARDRHPFGCVATRAASEGHRDLG